MDTADDSPYAPETEGASADIAQGGDDDHAGTQDASNGPDSTSEAFPVEPTRDADTDETARPDDKTTAGTGAQSTAAPTGAAEADNAASDSQPTGQPEQTPSITAQSASSFELVCTAHTADPDTGTESLAIEALLELHTDVSAPAGNPTEADLDALASSNSLPILCDGTFYLLLPASSSIDAAAAYAPTAQGEPQVAPEVELISNWRGTGLDMAVLTVHAPQRNYRLSQTTATAQIDVNLVVTYPAADGQEVLGAFVNASGDITGGLADCGKPGFEAMTDLDGDGNPEGTPANTLYAQVTPPTLDSPESDGIAAYKAAVPLAASTDIAGAQNLSSMASSANAWQVVSGAFSGNGAKDKTASPDGKVRLQKNVVPTGTENEFLVYLSVDYKTAFTEYFKTAQYQATTSNNYHDQHLGTVVNAMTGNEKVQVSGTQAYSNSGTFTVQDPSGNVIASNVTLYWSQANNVTFYLKTKDSHYILFGLSVKKNSSNTVRLSSEAWQLVQQDALTAAELDRVSDTMGSEIEYVETVEADGTTSYDEGTKTLTWLPQAKDTAQESSVAGDTTSIWHLNAAELIYKVRLHPGASAGIQTGSDGTAYVGNAAIYDVNSRATLTYDGSSTTDFPVPQVRSLLYDIAFTKLAADTGAALSGATFQLQKLDGAGWADVEGAVCISDENGLVSFTGLEWGTYRAMETRAPYGYKAVDSQGDAIAWHADGVELCWTTGAARLTASTQTEGNAMLSNGSDASQVTDPRLTRLAVIKQDDGAQPLVGVQFQLIDADNAVAAQATTTLVQVSRDGKTETVALADFGDVATGRYTLVESRVAAGYTDVSHTGYSLTVSDAGISMTASDGAEARLNLLDDPTGTPSYYTTLTNYALPDMPQTGGGGAAAATSLGTCALLGGAMVLLRSRRTETRRRGARKL